MLVGRIEKSSKLTTAELHYTGMSEFKDKGVTFINKSDFIMVYKATASYGIELDKVDISVDNFKKIVVIRIPKVKIFNIKIDAKSIKYFDEKFSLFNFDEKDDSNDAISLAEKEAKKELEKMGALETAENQAKSLVIGLIDDLIPKNFDIKVVKK